MTIKLKSVLKWLKCGFSERSKLASHSTVYCFRKVFFFFFNRKGKEGKYCLVLATRLIFGQ